MPADTITILCVHCAAKLKVPPASAPGKKGRCPKCGTANDIPVADPKPPASPDTAPGFTPIPQFKSVKSQDSDNKIKVACACGKRYRLDPRHAGKRVACPACHATFTIPAPPSTGQFTPIPDPDNAPPGTFTPVADQNIDLADVAAGMQPVTPAAPLDAATATTCPNCQHPCDPEAKICINCGTNLKTGRRLLTKDRANVDHEAHEVLAWLSWVSLIIPVSLAPYRSTVAARRTWPFTKILITLTVIISGLYLISIWTTPEPQTLDELIAIADSPTHQFMLWPGENFQEFQLITHIFLHGGLAHLAGNMIFLAAFGVAIYQALGWFYPLIYLALGVFAGLVGHLMLSDPANPVPLLGASGAIAGFSAGVVLGFILLITRAVKTEGYDLLTWVFGNRWRPRSDRADTQ